MTLDEKDEVIQEYCRILCSDECIIKPICDEVRGEFLSNPDALNRAYDIICSSNPTDEKVPKPTIESRKHKIQIKDIKIPMCFKATMPNSEKLKEKYEMYCKSGCFNSDIIIDEHNILVDGYCNYLIYKMFDVFEVTVIKIKVKKDV